MVKSSRKIVAALAAVCLSTGMSVAMAEPAAANTNTYSVEWYQFCYDHNPIPITSYNSGYMNAFWSASGVTCQYWAVPWRAGFPMIKKFYWPWTQVCWQYGYRSYYLQSGRYPVCTR